MALASLGCSSLRLVFSELFQHRKLQLYQSLNTPGSNISDSCHSHPGNLLEARLQEQPGLQDLRRRGRGAGTRAPGWVRRRARASKMELCWLPPPTARSPAGARPGSVGKRRGSQLAGQTDRQGPRSEDGGHNFKKKKREKRKKERKKKGKNASISGESTPKPT